ncbi:MAG: FHA domain-containing protein [Gemmatimonadetes bacterium]|nr:FHA domain-containing protein [Gemmatimonadota bacterium]NNM04107.1 FHA domain-containing protein [Gemmatimonadota bacterium]
MNLGSHTPSIRLRSEAGGAEDIDLTFTGSFKLGRDPDCQVQTSSSQVSRFHAEATPHAGTWWIRDLGSTNGLFLNEQPVDQSQLHDGDRLRLGRLGPILLINLVPLPGEVWPGPRRSHQNLVDPSGAPSTTRAATPDTGSTPHTSADRQTGGGPDLSLSDIEEKYLNPSSDQPAGQHTRMIRVAYERIRKKQKKRSTLILGAVLVLLATSVTYAVYQRRRVQVLDRRAAEVFRTIKSYEVQLVSLRQLAEGSGSSELEEQLSRIDSLRQEVMADYDGYVRDRGLYRRLGSPEEVLIFRTARLFGESEFAVSGGFVQAVLEEIEGYWLSPGGRSRFEEGLERADQNGYTGRIVEAMRRQGVAPEFFYLALQESDFKADAVGPDTRWGRAKGMWQFIPSTAERYGLDPGALSGTAQRDPADDRQDFSLASDAAARYLRDLHGILTQASGLLVMAAYNWGEHRVAPRLESLPTPRDVFQAEFAEVPTDPSSRNYWTFLREYEDRMPEQTKDYVLKIFSAAVIGQDPRHFGFDFDNPLEPFGN